MLAEHASVKRREVVDYMSKRARHIWHPGHTLLVWQHGLSEETNDICTTPKKHQHYLQYSIVAHSGHHDAKGVLFHIHSVI